MHSNKLEEFRRAAYQNLGRAHDATFELTDAILLTRHADSLADLSLSPVFRRQWSSVYEALQDCRPSRQKLMKLYIEQIPTDVRPILAIDHTSWSRPDAQTLQERTIEHKATKVPGNKPITVGQGYSTIAWIPETEGSWALPLRHERITSWESPISKAVWQLLQLCKYLTVRPIVLLDSEYGCAPFVLKSAHIKADKLIRLRSNLVLWGSPPPYSGHGAPRKHGEKFKLNDPSSWDTPAQSLEIDDPKLGTLRITWWQDKHFKAAATQTMQILRVERLNSDGSGCLGRPLWLVWIGEEMLPLSQLWKLYLRRFAIDHWYRFLKQRLHWQKPQLSTPKQCERWSDLMPLLTWELWLARMAVADNPLPWQKPTTKLTPGRVAQAFAGILVEIGTPAHPPKTRGKSPGWPPGKPRRPSTRYPLVKKRYSKPKSSPKKTA
ncbi:MAG TPA: NF041680 family putative transposase [Vampirovibrionales bacterium]